MLHEFTNEDKLKELNIYASPFFFPFFTINTSELQDFSNRCIYFNKCQLV